VTGLSTFNQDVIIKGTNVPTKFSSLDSSISTLTSGLSTANANIATLDTNKADKANPTFTGTATFNTITTQSLTDNGNITIKGNTIIGDASGDTLVVTGLSTFSISSLPYSGVII
jgi:hypothetical protein